MSGAAPTGGRGREDAGPAISRSLLFPGPMAPLSHLGATLLRHVVASGLRYALYQLGLPPPDRPPIRIHRLRLYLDGPELTRQLAGHPGGEEVARALVEPGGTRLDRHGAGAPAADATSRQRRLTGAAALHRLRLRLESPFRGPVRGAAVPAGQATWAALRVALSSALPALHDALLGELLASLARRHRRGAGHEVPPCLGREAWRHSAGRRARLDHLGPPDLLARSWIAAPVEPPAGGSEPGPLPPRDRFRGRFRERYRATLDALRPALLAIAERACARGLLERADDAFFLPFDLADELELETPPRWLAPAVAANRREHAALLETPGPPEVLGEEPASLSGDDRPAWAAQPLAPLP